MTTSATPIPRPEHIAIRPDRGRVLPGLRELWGHRELLYFFVWRDLKVRYKQSIIGVGWAVLQPLLLMIIFTLFFGRFARIPSQGPRPVFYYSALLLWSYFSQSVNLAAQSVQGNAAMLTKVYFPRLLLPLSNVIAGVVDFAIAFLMLVVLMAYYVIHHARNVHLGLESLYVIPLVILVVITALAVSLWLSALHARYHDIRYVVTFFLQLWLFASPIMYPSTIVPARFRTLYRLNPMAGAIDGLRWSLTGIGTKPDLTVAISAGITIVVLFFGIRYFKKFEGTLADVV